MEVDDLGVPKRAGNERTEENREQTNLQVQHDTNFGQESSHAKSSNGHMTITKPDVVFWIHVGEYVYYMIANIPS
jgi:hypothetical protein